MKDKKVVIAGKEYYYERMSDEALEILFKTIKEKELNVYKKILKAKNVLKQYGENEGE
ncbi:MAG: hypothetical protein IKL55_01880 [Clostridia bacterium]|nr:hypothetical protein [Clostridia bacterium]